MVNLYFLYSFFSPHRYPSDFNSSFSPLFFFLFLLFLSSLHVVILIIFPRQFFNQAFSLICEKKSWLFYFRGEKSFSIGQKKFDWLHSYLSGADLNGLSIYLFTGDVVSVLFVTLEWLSLHGLSIMLIVKWIEMNWNVKLNVKSPNDPWSSFLFSPPRLRS